MLYIKDTPEYQSGYDSKAGDYLRVVPGFSHLYASRLLPINPTHQSLSFAMLEKGAGIVPASLGFDVQEFYLSPSDPRHEPPDYWRGCV